MPITEQVKAIEKQIKFLNQYKKTFTKGDTTKEIEFDYTVRSLQAAVNSLNELDKFRLSLIQ